MPEIFVTPFFPSLFLQHDDFWFASHKIKVFHWYFLYFLVHANVSELICFNFLHKKTKAWMVFYYQEEFWLNGLFVNWFIYILTEFKCMSKKISHMIDFGQLEECLINIYFKTFWWFWVLVTFMCVCLWMCVCTFLFGCQT